MSEELTACPKCGGVNGYTGNLTLSYDMQGAWGQEWETTGSERLVHRSRIVRCADCGLRISLKLASGGKDDES